jgi:CRP-like cAMP-binding protein
VSVTTLESGSRHLVEVLGESELFSDLPRQALTALAAGLERVPVAAGTTVMPAGETGDALYIVAAGRLRLLHDDVVIGELSVGQLVGELALFSDRPRVATVIAARDSVLLRLSTAAFQSLSRRHPEIVMALARRVAERVTPVAGVARGVGTVRTIAVVAAGGTPTQDVRRFAEQLARSLSGRTRLIGARTLDRIGARSEADVTGTLDRIERDHRFVVYLTDPARPAFTRLCLRQADRVLLVGRAVADPQPNATEAAVDAAVTTELVLLQPAGVDMPGGTAAWWAVRASIALPGILPPVWDAGDLLVDGGLVSNLPVEVMQRRVEGKIVAVDLEPAAEPPSYPHFGPTLSGWRAAAHRPR